eukprot:maker-scaffold_11-snap-gene-7.1-mRNA-1 protein AED:0.02 eAED:0.02 QI:109/1/1/1/0.75/0.6/5/90/677
MARKKVKSSTKVLKKETKGTNANYDSENDDDFLSAWLDCLRDGKPWGGRGSGGRGIQRVTGKSKNVWIPNVSLNRGRSTLLENGVLRLNYGTRYGLLGKNGCGKSTLLNRISRQRLPGFPPYLRVQMLHQELFSSRESASELEALDPVNFVLKHDVERTQLQEEETHLLEQLERNDLGEEESLLVQEKLQELYSKMESNGDYESEEKAKRLLQKFGFQKKNASLLQKKFSELSGGWKMRVCLAGCLFMDPDVLLLDEPTNHLDAKAICWLENFLSGEYFKGTLLVVTHDRSFLTNVCEEIILLRQKKLGYFAGNYEEYIQLKDQKYNMQVRKSEALEKKKEALQKGIERSRKSKISKQQKQATTKQKKLDRINEAGFGRADGFRYRMQADNSPARYKEHVPQAIDLDEPPVKLSFGTDVSAAEGRLVTFENLTFGYLIPDTNNTMKVLVRGFTGHIDRKSKVGLISPNGTGKSSFIQLLLQQLEFPDAGTAESLRYNGKITRAAGARPRVAYLSQESISQLDGSSSGAEQVIRRSEQLKVENYTVFHYIDTVPKARQFLGGFGIKDDVAIRKIATLSGGQKVRVALALQFLLQPDFLILDEPSNHLDLESVEQLCDALQSYRGGALIVSHDRFLLSRSCSEIWYIHGSSKCIHRVPLERSSTGGEKLKAIEDIVEML